MEGEKKLRLKEAGTLSGYHSDYLGYLIRTGKLKGEKLGKSWFILEADLKELLQQKRGLPPAEDTSEIKVVEAVQTDTSPVLGMFWPKFVLASAVAVLFVLSFIFSLILTYGKPTLAEFQAPEVEKYQPTEQEKIISASVFGD